MWLLWDCRPFFNWINRIIHGFFIIVINKWDMYDNNNWPITYALIALSSLDGTGRSFSVQSFICDRWLSFSSGRCTHIYNKSWTFHLNLFCWHLFFVCKPLNIFSFFFKVKKSLFFDVGVQVCLLVQSFSEV